MVNTDQAYLKGEHPRNGRTLARSRLLSCSYSHPPLLSGHLLGNQCLYIQYTVWNEHLLGNTRYLRHISNHILGCGRLLAKSDLHNRNSYSHRPSWNKRLLGSCCLYIRWRGHFLGNTRPLRRSSNHTLGSGRPLAKFHLCSRSYSYQPFGSRHILRNYYPLSSRTPALRGQASSGQLLYPERPPRPPTRRSDPNSSPQQPQSTTLATQAFLEQTLQPTNVKTPDPHLPPRPAGHIALYMAVYEARPKRKDPYNVT
jgi:hypothetical protein